MYVQLPLNSHTRKRWGLETDWVGIDVVRMASGDLPQAISACELINVSTDEKGWYFIVGSAVELSAEDEPKEGFIRVFEVVETGGRRRLNKCAEIKVAGSVYCVDQCDGKLVCGVGSTVPPSYPPPTGKTHEVNVCLFV